MPVRGVDSGRSSPRTLKSAPIMSSIAREVSVEHGHRTEAERLDGLQPFSSEVEGVSGITDEDITAKDAPVAVARLPKEVSSMFERREVIRSVVGEENLLGLNLFEQLNVPRPKEFSLDAACELRPVLLEFKHVKNSPDMVFRTC